MKKDRLKYLIFILIVSSLISACTNEVNKEAELAELLKTDKEFNDLSIKEGLKAAFYQYADENSLMLPNFNQPVFGKESLLEFLSSDEDDGELRWTPESGEVSSSGDLGYTWGRYTYTFLDSTATPGKSHGKYVTIWKKQKDGTWKWLVDIGNQNLDPEK